MSCILEAWHRHEKELGRFLRHRSASDAEADDLLQEVFLRVADQGARFCGVGNQRAWLYQVARNLLIDRMRLAKEQVQLPDDLATEDLPAASPVDQLSQCLPRVLAELTSEDREAILVCDIEGLTQQSYAERLGITLAGAKSRVQRARRRLRERLLESCQVRLDDAGHVCCFVPRPPL